VIFTRDEWGGFFEHIVPPRAQAPNNVDTDLINGKALLGIRVPTAIVSPWTVGNPANPTVTSEIFDHTSVLKLIESVFGVAPLAARETSTDVGNILDVIDVTRPAMAAPQLPVANPVFPQQLCTGGGITDGSGLPTSVSGVTRIRRPSPFHRMIEAGMLDAWPR
jgi:phospholipase C